MILSQLAQLWRVDLLPRVIIHWRVFKKTIILQCYQCYDITIADRIQSGGNLRVEYHSTKPVGIKIKAQESQENGHMISKYYNFHGIALIPSVTSCNDPWCSF